MTWIDKESDAQPEPPMEPPYYGSWINGDTGEWHPDAPQQVIERMERIMLGDRSALEMPETAEEPPRKYSTLSSIASWQTTIHDWAQAKGFWDVPFSLEPGILFDETTFLLSKLMLAVTELAEAAEAVRKGDAENYCEELADAVIRLFDTAEASGVNLAQEMVEKMKANEQRPQKHGKRA